MSTNHQLDEMLNAEADKKNQSAKKSARILGIVVVLVVVIWAGVTAFWSEPSATSNQTSPSPEDQTESYSSVQLETARSEFTRLLTELDSKYTLASQRAGFQSFAESELMRVEALKNEALAEFADGAFVQAQKRLFDAADLLQTTVDKWEADFVESMASASLNFESANIARAQLSLNHAAKLKPNDASVSALQKRIDVYEQVASELDRYRVAQIENDINKQIDALQNILSLDPARRELQSELKRLLQARQENQIAQGVQLGMQYYELGNLKAAQQQLSKLLQLAPTRSSVKELQTLLNQSRASISENEQLILIKELVDEQDWRSVSVATQQLLDNQPGNQTAVELNKKAFKILSTQTKIEQLNAQPRRLYDDSIRDYAIGMMAEAVPLLSSSKELSQQLATLSKWVEEARTPIKVQIVSDNQSFISIKGKGNIGQVTQTELTLTPGEYTFEAKRQGFRSKQILLTLTPDQSTATIELSCDEPI